MKPDAFLAALQLADSALPIGRFAHSSGLEALLRGDSGVGESDLVEIVESFLLESAGPLDGVALAHAHRAGTLEELRMLDRLVTTRKLTPAARLASISCGRQLAGLAALLTETDPAAAYCAEAVEGATDGNLAVVEGALARARGLGEEEAVLLELRGAAWAILSAAVRLGRLSARRAQAALVGLEPALRAAATEALTLPAESMRSSVPELEVHALRHGWADARLFAT